MAETFDTLLDKLRPATLAEIAERCGLSLRALADLRAGRVSDPRRATVIALSVALKCKPSRVRAAIAASYAAGQG
jgi:transcriptional regulator with XRE-family HTH domain